MTLTADQIQKLEAPLDPAHVVKPTGNFGPKGDYLEGWHIINELNRVFGFDGWSYTVQLTRDALTEAEVVKSGQTSMQWQAAYTCVCTLTAAGVTRQDVGFGSGFAKGIGDAIEGATKEATTDALKRCARTFGNIFGLALYDKSRANVGRPEPTDPPKISDDQLTKIMDFMESGGVPVAELLAAAKVEKASDILAANFDRVMGWVDRRLKAKVEQEAG